MISKIINTILGVEVLVIQLIFVCGGVGQHWFHGCILYRTIVLNQQLEVHHQKAFDPSKSPHQSRFL
jgi:hypothetical protein